MTHPSLQHVVVIGAGPAGLTAARNLLRWGFQVRLCEAQADLGGVWNFSSPGGRVYRSTHMISSKGFTQYPDFPLPREYPQYPSHEQVLRYLRSYAEHFGLLERIEFSAQVQQVERHADGPGWQVRLRDGRVHEADAVVVANGHHRTPWLPEYPGKFSGQTIHSADYKTPDILAGRRVLVVGGGNSGCDIAVEAAQQGCRTFHSTRRGYHYIPKWIFGWPADRVGDRLHQWHFPIGLRRWITRIALRMTVGKLSRYGLPRPDHALFETHPIVNSLLPYYIGQGDIAPKPDIARFDGQTVVFADGSREEIDLIVYATGYRLEFPFLDARLLPWRDGRPDLYLNVFPANEDRLFVAGMIQPDSGIFGLMHWQMLAAATFLASVRDGHSVAERFRAERQRELGRDTLGGGIAYQRSARHAIEVEHWSYRRRLQQLVKRLLAGRPLPETPPALLRPVASST